jgi:hypothetical protein
MFQLNEEEFENLNEKHDKEIRLIFKVIRQMMAQPEEKKRKT